MPWIVGRIGLGGGRKNENAKQGGEVRRRAKRNQARAKEQVKMGLGGHRNRPRRSQRRA